MSSGRLSKTIRGTELLILAWIEFVLLFFFVCLYVSVNLIVFGRLSYSLEQIDFLSNNAP